MGSDKMKRLNDLLEIKKHSPPDYWVNREISQLKKALGIPVAKSVSRKERKKVETPQMKPHMQGVKVALDVGVGYKAAAFLKKMGLDIVVHAEHAEHDDDWVGRALKLGVDVIVSSDQQVRFTAKVNNVLAVTLAGMDRSGHKLYRAIVFEFENMLWPVTDEP